MRILIGTAGRIESRSGASQIVVHLAAALSELGHAVEAMGDAPPIDLPARRHRAWHLDQIAARVRTKGPFDAVDVPPILARAGLAGEGLLVVRSTQPELRYLRAEAAEALGRALRGSARAALSLLFLAIRRRWVQSGWKAASLMFCLGSLEHEWMRRNCPKLADRLRVYVIAPGESDRRRLQRVRAERRLPAVAGVRFLWIGRWTRHKGTQALRRFALERLSRCREDSLTLAGTGIEPSIRWPEAVRDRIRIVPAFERGELPALLAQHHAGIFTSVAEGWGLSIQEMLESGMPLLATPEGAVPDLRPYFPEAIHAFPPHPGWCAPGAAVSPTATYERRFSWESIAREYAEAVEAARPESRARRN